VCDESTIHLMPVPGWGQMRECGSPDFVLANPRRWPSAPEGMFAGAYAGDTDTNTVDESQVRTPFGSRFLRNPRNVLWPSVSLVRTCLRVQRFPGLASV